VSGNFLVRQARGPAWDPALRRREQVGWEEHAAFVDRLVAEGRVLLGGPVGEADGELAELVVAAEDEAGARALFEADPWRDRILRIAGVERWNLWVGAERLGVGESVGGGAAGGRLALARAMLVLLCLYALILGALAAFAPHTFYDDFPFFSHWVELLPPYNEHLVTDVGGLYLALAVIFAWAAWSLQRTLVRAACTGFLLAAVLHLVFHAGHLEGFGTVDGVAEIAALASLLLPPAIAIWGADDAV
jgi:uncharacterized protein YciI